VNLCNPHSGRTSFPVALASFRRWWGCLDCNRNALPWQASRNIECAGMLFTCLILLSDLGKRITFVCHRAERDSVIANGTFFSDHFLLGLPLAFFKLGNCFVLLARGSCFVLFCAGNCLVLFTLRSRRNISIISRSGSMLSASSRRASAAR